MSSFKSIGFMANLFSGVGGHDGRLHLSRAIFWLGQNVWESCVIPLDLFASIPGRPGFQLAFHKEWKTWNDVTAQHLAVPWAQDQGSVYKKNVIQTFCLRRTCVLQALVWWLHFLWSWEEHTCNMCLWCSRTLRARKCECTNLNSLLTWASSEH